MRLPSAFDGWARRLASWVAALCLAFLVLHVSVAQAATASSAWRLQAYHLFQHSDAATLVTSKTAATSAPTLLGDMDLMEDRCTLDSTLEVPSAKKSAAATATRQSLSLNLTRLAPIIPLTGFAVRSRATARRVAEEVAVQRVNSDTAPAESPASAAVLQRAVEPTLLHSVGTLHLGVFLAESVDGFVGARAGGDEGLADGGTTDGNDGAALEPLTDAGDETDREYDVTVFVGDLSRHLCVSAALYPTLATVGDHAAALAVWVPPSVSPACALRVSPLLARDLQHPFVDADLLSTWPPTREEQCRVSEATEFRFRFKPALALAKAPSFCVYEDTQNVTAAPLSGSRRQVRCEVYLDVHVTTWYADSLFTNADVASLKLVAAVTEASTTAAAATGVDTGRTAAGVRHVSTDGEVSTPGSAAGRWKGAAWCTTAQVGRGFWFSDALDCAEAVQEELSGMKSGVVIKSYVAVESVALSFGAVALVVVSALATSYSINAVRARRSRRIALR